MLLNILPFKLTINSLYYLSATLSIFYFIIAIFEIFHIFYNKLRPDYDWDYDKKDMSNLHNHYSIYLVMLTTIYFILLLLLIIIFPYFNL